MKQFSVKQLVAMNVGWWFGIAVFGELDKVGMTSCTTITIFSFLLYFISKKVK